MKKLLLAGVAAGSLVSGSAMAADMPLKAPRPVAYAPPEYAGWYAGVSLGYSHSRAETSQTLHQGERCLTGGGGGNGCQLQKLNVDSIAPGLKRDSFTGGFQAGYNWRFGVFLVGIEGDINYVNLNRTETSQVTWTNSGNNTLTVATTESIKSNYVATLRPRIGFVIPYNILVYVTGGFALSDQKFSNETAITNLGGGATPVGLHALYSGSSSNRFGSVVGGGFEYAWSPGTTLKVEYQHLRFDFPDVTGFNTVLLGLSLDGSALTSRAKVSADIVRVGLNYSFGGWGKAPVAARY